MDSTSANTVPSDHPLLIGDAMSRSDGMWRTRWAAAGAAVAVAIAGGGIIHKNKVGGDNICA